MTEITPLLELLKLKDESLKQSEELLKLKEEQLKLMKEKLKRAEQKQAFMERLTTHTENTLTMVKAFQEANPQLSFKQALKEVTLSVLANFDTP